MTQTMIIVAIACAVALAGAAGVYLIGRAQMRNNAQPMATDEEMDRAFTPRVLNAREKYEATTKGAIVSAIHRLA